MMRLFEKCNVFFFVFISSDVYFAVLLYLIQKFISTDLDGVERKMNISEFCSSAYILYSGYMKNIMIRLFPA